MNDNDASITGNSTRRPPWNKGKIIGPKPPLRQGHVWSIRTRLQLKKRIRDLALFDGDQNIDAFDERGKFAFGNGDVDIEHDAAIRISDLPDIANPLEWGQHLEAFVSNGHRLNLPKRGRNTNEPRQTMYTWTVVATLLKLS